LAASKAGRPPGPSKGVAMQGGGRRGNRKNWRFMPEQKKIERGRRESPAHCPKNKRKKKGRKKRFVVKTSQEKKDESIGRERPRKK